MSAFVILIIITVILLFIMAISLTISIFNINNSLYIALSNVRSARTWISLALVLSWLSALLLLFIVIIGFAYELFTLPQSLSCGGCPIATTCNVEERERDSSIIFFILIVIGILVLMSVIFAIIGMSAILSISNRPSKLNVVWITALIAAIIGAVVVIFLIIDIILYNNIRKNLCSKREQKSSVSIVQ
jgi:hypothetical protein